MSIVDLFQFPGDKLELVDCGKTADRRSRFLLLKETTFEGHVYHHVQIGDAPFRRVDLKDWHAAQKAAALAAACKSEARS